MYSSAGHGINISWYVLNLSNTLSMLTTVSNLWKPSIMEITKKQTNKILTWYSYRLFFLQLGGKVVLRFVDVCLFSGWWQWFVWEIAHHFSSVIFQDSEFFQHKSRGFLLGCTFLNVHFKMATILHSKLQHDVSALSDSHCFLLLPKVRYVSFLLLNDKLSVIFLQIHKTY